MANTTGVLSMIVTTDIAATRNQLKAWRRGDATVGFVPTMGFLHAGHLSLISKSVARHDFTVVSIYVNPAQFGPEMDLDRYPRDVERDRLLLEEAGVDLLFLPDDAMMYPDGFATWVEVEGLTRLLDGGSRAGYFRGICTICTKLFNIVRPDRAYFGQKDIQQALVLTRMVADLDLNLDVEIVPTVRDDDGLALSSRNVYLDERKRAQALAIPRALKRVERAFDSGVRDANRLIEVAKEVLAEEDALVVDYVELVDYERIERLQGHVDSRAILAIACDLGGTRLIDNTILGR